MEGVEENISGTVDNWVRQQRAFAAVHGEVPSEFESARPCVSQSGTETSASDDSDDDEDDEDDKGIAENRRDEGGGDYEEDNEQDVANPAAGVSQDKASTNRHEEDEDSESSDSDGDEDQADEEISAESVLDYARLHGLTINFSSERTPLLLPPVTPADLAQELEDPPDARPFEVPASFTTPETWAVNKDAAQMLKTVVALTSGHFEVYDPALDNHRSRDLKVEVPMLRSDHELDVMEFRRTADRNPHIILPSLAPADEEKDEGFDWPTRYKSLPAEFEAKTRSEKLEVTKEQLRYLQDLLRDAFTTDDEDAVFTAELRYRRNIALEPVTPPLLPLSPPTKPVELSPIDQLEPLPEGTSPTKEEARALNERIMKDDAITPQRKRKAPDHDPVLFDEDDLQHYYSPLASIEKSPSLTPPKRIRLAELKVEGPLTPPTSVEVSGKHRKVTFAEDLEEIIPNWPPIWDKPEGAPSSEDDVDRFFEQTVAPLARQAELEVQHEQLQEADSTMRVAVPVLDFSVPDPPWKKDARKMGTTAGDGHRHLDYLHSLQEDLRRTIWSGISNIERSLPWSPFPLELGRAAIEEDIVDDGSLADLVRAVKLDEIVHSESLTWKPEGLRVLDTSDEEEEEVEPADFGEQTDISTLLRKRKLQLVEEHGAALCGRTGDPRAVPVDQAQHPQGSHAKDVGNMRGAQWDAPETETHSDLMFGGMFSASEALTKFMESQGRAPKRHKQAEGVNMQAAAAQPPTASNPPREPDIVTHIHAQDNGITISEPTQSLPSLELPEDLPPKAFIFSSTLFTKRRLIRYINTLYPAAQIIERDFASRTALATSPSFPSNNSKASSAPTEAEEADLLLSPSTGLLLTTLQKIKQRSLPGQASRNTVKDRIQRIAPRYERLLILVSEGRPAPAPPATIVDHFSSTRQPSVAHPIQPLQDRDCEALTQLTSFSATLDADMTITYVPGGEEDLAKWIVAAMYRYGLDSADVNLLQDETLWEIWLRAAGMNAFAAQVVLSELKAPEAEAADEAIQPVGESSQSDLAALPCSSGVASSQYGLPAFVLMSEEERRTRFEALLGGRRVLKRVGEVLDQRWTEPIAPFLPHALRR